MSDYVPKKGDRAQFVVEGKITHVNLNGIVYVGDINRQRSIILPEHTVSVEKIGPPLPTAAGSSIWWFNGAAGKIPLVLDGRGNWGNADFSVAPSDKIEQDGFDVIFDAGA